MTNPEKPASQVHGTQQVLSGEERRRSQRVMIRFPVTLQLVIANSPVTIQAATVSVNNDGAMLLCPRPIDAETKFEIQNDRSREKQLCRVVRAPLKRPDGYLVPIELSKPGASFWGISFPPANWKATQE